MKKIVITILAFACIVCLAGAAIQLYKISSSDEALPIYDGLAPELVVKMLDFDATVSQYGNKTWQSTLAVEDINKVRETFEKCGYSLIDAPTIEGALNPPVVLGAGNRIVTLQKTSDSVRVVWDESHRDIFTLLFPNESTGTGVVTMAQIGTERTVEEDNPMNGMCYVYKLSDGSAVIIDGGHTSNSENLYNTIKTLDIAKDADGRYLITAWVLTHGHGDHYGALLTFAQKYRDQSDVKYLVYSFPIDGVSLSVQDCHVPSFVEYIDASYPGVKHIVPHAGLKYHFGNLTLEMLYTPELLTYVNYSNDTSLMFIADGNGGRVLHTGDAGERASERTLMEYEEKAFNSNALQISHHGFVPHVNHPHDWDYLGKIYSYSNASIGLLPMGTRLVGDERNGRYSVLVWGTMINTHAAFMVDDRPSETNLVLDTQADFDRFVADVAAGTAQYETLYGYNGVNMIFGKNGMTTYIMSAETENMATVFTLSKQGMTVISNELLSEWFESSSLDK